MGSPDHYGVELPVRCMKLVDELWPHVEKVFPDDGNHLGPLTATFLISLANPMINLPIERVERHQGNKIKGYADDSEIRPEVAERITSCLGGNPIRNAPFYNEEAWAYHREESEEINIGFGLPNCVADALSKPEAISLATRLPGSQWASILRNSLAHGGIAYLDADGRMAHDSPADMFVFVNGRYKRDDCGRPVKLIGVDTLRVSMSNFQSFLRSWVGWLKNG